jgi:ferredoxin
MAYKIITSQCTVCGACEFECPNAAISLKNDTYVINPKKCTECIGYFDEAQCEAVCPVDKTCVIDPAQPRYQPRA